MSRLFTIIVPIVTLCVVAGIKIVRSVIDNAFHWKFDKGGLGTRMCVIVHPDDVTRAQPIVERVLNPPSPCARGRDFE